MKLNIAETAPPRVVLPFRLHVRGEDLPAYQAATLSDRTFVDASIDLGPEDFPSDPVRLAARDLAAVLRNENQRRHDHYYVHADKSVIAGMLVIEIAYPFKESDIRQAAIDLITEAMEQQNFVESAFAAFEGWTREVKSTLCTTAKALLKKHEKALSQFQRLQLRRKAAVGALDQSNLRSVVDAYRKLVREIPSEEDIQDTLTSAIQGGSLPLQAEYLAVRLHTNRLMAGFHLRDRSTISRTASSVPSVSIFIEVVASDEHIATAKASLRCRIAISGSLIEGKERSFSTEFTDLDPLIAAVCQVEKDWGECGQMVDEDEIPADISEALKRIETNAMVDEMNQWIQHHGSPSLKLGHEQKFSMTRQYRLERAQSVLSDLLAPYPGWALVLAGDFADGTSSAEKASPSARALNVLVGLKVFAPGVTICYAAVLCEKMAPEDGEYLWIPPGECFPGAPGLAICWPLTIPAKKAPKRRH